jgi:aldehyde:ferredoxin oxidoreductase
MAIRYAGYAGRILDVDLGARTSRLYPVPDATFEQFLGGKALAARILWDEIEPGIDPLSPRNVMVFTTGPLTGSGAPAASRFNCSSKNVLTGGIISSNCGGDFGLYLKRAGYDGLIVRGRADIPTWLEIDETSVRFLDARHLWGLDVEETQAELPKKVGHVVIGPAGENLVRYAAILSGERVLGRGGVGAIMGSKNLKVITASGARRMRFHDAKAFGKSVEKWVGTLQKHSITGRQLPRYGTAAMVTGTNATNTLPTHNFQRGNWAHAHEIGGDVMAERDLVMNDGCTSCPIKCGRMVNHAGRHMKGPEFETVGMFGSNIENRELPRIYDWNRLCDLLGMDTISLGSTLASAMELGERGLMPDLPVAFGDHAAMDQLLHDIAWRRGIGDVLAEGAMRMAQRYGAPEVAMHSKGMEFAAYEPRGAVGHGLGYATSNRGGCHINGGYLIFFEALGPVNIDPLTPLAKPALAIFQQNTFEAVAAAGGCIFPTYAILPDMPAWLGNAHGRGSRIMGEVLKMSRRILGGQGRMSPTSLGFHLPLIPHTKSIETLTGMKLRLGSFTAVGERGFTLERMFNLREGLTAEDDSLPKRLTDEPQRKDRPDSVVPLKEMLPVYYEVRDWDGNGVPRQRLLQKLDMGYAESVVATLERDPQALKARRTALFANEPAVLQAVLAPARQWQHPAEGVREALRAAFNRRRAIERADRIRQSTFQVDEARCQQCGLCARACPVDAIRWIEGSLAFIEQEKCIRCGECWVACPPHYDAVVLHPAGAEKDRTAVAYRVIDEKCEKCGICFKKCPVDAIAWQKKELARIDDALCVACGRCKEVCPPKWAAIVVETRSVGPQPSIPPTAGGNP